MFISARKCSVCGAPLPGGDISQIYCSLPCQLKRDPIDTSLSDEQLERVRGGMSQQIFSSWRAEYLNENR